MDLGQKVKALKGLNWLRDAPVAELDELARIAPAETLWPEEMGQVTSNVLARTGKDAYPTLRPAWAFGLDYAVKTLTRHFGTASLEGFGFGDDDSPAIRAAGAILDYLSETQKTSLDHFDRLIPCTKSFAYC